MNLTRQVLDDIEAAVRHSRSDDWARLTEAIHAD